MWIIILKYSILEKRHINLIYCEIINYTINFGMIVVVEGIETEEQYKFLLESNYDTF